MCDRPAGIVCKTTHNDINPSGIDSDGRRSGKEEVTEWNGDEWIIFLVPTHGRGNEAISVEKSDCGWENG